METIQYQPKGVCSNYMEIDVDGGVIQDCRVKGGCTGILKGSAHLGKGRRVQDAIQRREGIRGGFKNTSCQDQLARALKIYHGE